MLSFVDNMFIRHAVNMLCFWIHCYCTEHGQKSSLQAKIFEENSRIATRGKYYRGAKIGAQEK